MDGIIVAISASTYASGQHNKGENKHEMNAQNNESTVLEQQDGKAGRPTKYEPKTVERLLATLSDGLTIKQACLAAGIGQSTLSDWLERHPELEAQLAEAREQARQKALAGVKAAGEAGDWRARAKF